MRLTQTIVFNRIALAPSFSRSTSLSPTRSWIAMLFAFGGVQFHLESSRGSKKAENDGWKHSAVS